MPEVLDFKVAMENFDKLPADAGLIIFPSNELFEPRFFTPSNETVYFTVDDSRHEYAYCEYLNAFVAGGLIGGWKLIYETCDCGRDGGPSWYCRECGDTLICKECCIYLAWTGTGPACRKCIKTCGVCGEGYPIGESCCGEHFEDSDEEDEVESDDANENDKDEDEKEAEQKNEVD